MDPDGTVIRPEGVHLIRELPESFKIEPMPFVAGSRAVWENFFDAIK